MAFFDEVRSTLTKWVWQFVTQYTAKIAASITAIATAVGMAVWVAYDNIFQTLWLSLPVGLQGELAPYIPYMETINLWFPLKELFVAVLAYYYFLVVFITIKYVIKMIPTIG